MRRTQAKGVREQGTEENICAEGVGGGVMLADEIKDSDMGRACSTHEGEEN